MFHSRFLLASISQFFMIIELYSGGILGANNLPFSLSSSNLLSQFFHQIVSYIRFHSVSLKLGMFFISSILQITLKSCQSNLMYSQ